MRLVLVRHAAADPGTPDELRPLSAEGQQQARELAERLAAERPDAVLTSPLLRARETAAEIARAAGLEARVDERLAPGATADGLLAAAAETRGATVVAVCHQPDCGEIAAALGDGAQPPFPPTGTFAVDVS